MTNYFLLIYDSVPLGIYNKLCYLLDYILELTRFPGKKIDLTKIEINNLNVNIAYPDATLVFKINEKQDKIFLEETNGKRVEMCQETFTRFKKIQKYYKQIKINKKDPKKENKPIVKELTKEEKQLLEEKQKELSEKQEKLNEEHKTAVYEMNRLKHQLKMVTKWQNKYKADLKLYKEFKKNLEEDETFEIPEMFQEVFDFFEDSENLDDSFTDYFVIFNEDSNLEIEEINELLGEIEDDSDDENED